MNRNLTLIGISTLLLMPCSTQAASGDIYRNIALHRAATNSSSYDYNLTAQLLTDGIIPEEPACYIEITRDGKPMSRIERGYLTDLNSFGVELNAGSTLEVVFHGYSPAADKIQLASRNMPATRTTVKAEALGPDGKWTVIGTAEAAVVPVPIGYKGMTMYCWEFPTDASCRDYRFRFEGKSAVTLNEVLFFKDGKVADILPSKNFVSAWKSLGTESEWASIDLGGEVRFDKMRFSWINGPESGKVQVSEDGKEWKEIASFDGAREEISFPETRGRHVRLCLKNGNGGQPFELGEWEVYGHAPVRTVKGDGWILCRASETSEEAILSDSFKADANWIPAKVPGTVLGSYVEYGAVPDPNFADNQLFISDSYFRSDFWYRKSFDAKITSERQFLHFEGINYQAEVFLNGKRLGLIDGAFRAEDYDVTGILRDGSNVLAVKIIHNPSYGQVKEQTADTPDSNGGILGADNPTMHATIGWDWIPTVRGRNIGIYDDVWFTQTGSVTVEDPFVRTELPLPDTTKATVFASARLVNHGGSAVEGLLKISFGEHSAELPVSLAAGEDKEVAFEPMTILNPRLWWPKGYGEQNLYQVSMTFETGGKVSDTKEFLSGVRQMEYSLDPYKSDAKWNFNGRNDNERLSLYINGRRFVGYGGNWGYPEHMLNYGPREFDIAVGYHADMNFTMIRDWVGMTSHRAFYEACDRHGIMIWQDFWLANPSDGPDPSDVERFNETATRYVRRIRNHPSLALYVGRNEGYPPKEIDEHLDKIVKVEHPGLFYISHSAADGVSGGGPYRALKPSEYFKVRGREKMHSEMGMPAVMNYEHLLRAMGDKVEPFNTAAHPNPMYGLHDFALGTKANSAQKADSFNGLLAEAFGEPADAREFAELAQWINYDGYRAMFEGRGEHRRGLLLWMSHPAWPSMVWQTYDYYFEPTAAYFGCKKACEPLHIQFDPLRKHVEVVNTRAHDRKGLRAEAMVMDMHGTVVGTQKAIVDVAEDRTVTCFGLDVPAAAGQVYYLSLSLRDAEGRLLSSNFYVQGAREGDFKALRTLGKTSVEAGSEGDGPWKVTLKNTGSEPALMLRLKLVADGEMVLPVIYSDNYLSLMPGESWEIEISAPEAVRGGASLEISGFNMEPVEIKL